MRLFSIAADFSRRKKEENVLVENSRVPRYARNDIMGEKINGTARSLASLRMTKGFNLLNPFNPFNFL
jgi:hypothetical protein